MQTARCTAPHRLSTLSAAGALRCRVQQYGEFLFPSGVSSPFLVSPAGVLHVAHGLFEQCSEICPNSHPSRRTRARRIRFSRHFEDTSRTSPRPVNWKTPTIRKNETEILNPSRAFGLTEMWCAVCLFKCETSGLESETFVHTSRALGFPCIRVSHLLCGHHPDDLTGICVRV